MAKDARAIRSQARAVILRIDSAMSSVGMNSPGPWNMLRSAYMPSVHSRMMTRSISVPRCGTPGRVRAGRMLA